MKLKRAGQLLPSIQKDPKALVWIAGDDPLLLQESADAVRQHCRDAGFQEREVFNVDRGFDWSAFRATTDNLSLFAERKLIELRLSSPKLDDQAKKALHGYLEAPNPDYLLLLTSGRLEAAAQNTRWFKTIEGAGWFLPVWPLSADELPDWLSQRLLKAGLKPTPEAIALLVQRIEGNLLAAVQEIAKLRLLANPDSDAPVPLGADTVSGSVADSSRYTSFNLIDTALSGDATRTVKILHGLRDEGVEPLAILGALCGELRRLLPYTRQVLAGHPASRAADEAAGRNFKRKAPLARALQRLRPGHVHRLLDLARGVDCMVKGLQQGDVWQELEALVLQLSGTAVPGLRRPA